MIGRRFTVKDSIEMSRFGRSGGDPLFSPDRKHFVVVTSRGILKSNQIESTLWLFNSDEIRKFVQMDSAAKAPAPRVLARFSEVPQADSIDSYESIITDIRWLDDSHRLLFLAQNSRGERQLFKVAISGGPVRALTPVGLDVNRYAATPRTVVYMATSSHEQVKMGSSINRDAIDVTGLGWWSFLYPDFLAENYARCNELWVVRNGKSARVNAPGSYCLPHDEYNQVLSLSPDENSLVVAAPVQRIPKSWQLYRTPFPDRKIDPDSPEATVPSNPLRLTQYEMVNLKDGSKHSLLGSPNGWAVGYPDHNDAVWWRDGEKLLLLNTYLPLDLSTHEQQDQLRNLCSAAFVDLSSHFADCIMFARYPNQMSYVLTASFAGSPDRVLLELYDSADGKVQRQFQRVEGSWEPNDYGQTDSQRRPSEKQLSDLTIEIRQDLNTPPAIWATDCKTNHARKIWDPNPELSLFELGEASVFHWQDSSGHQWTGALVKPPDYAKGRRYPLVIQTHGFAEDEFMTDGAYTTAFAARPLAALGIVVLQMGKNYNYKSLADELPLQILGFESAIQHLASDGVTDPSKVGIIGFSRTCYHVEGALIKDPGLFAAATMADGVDESYIQAILSAVGASDHEGTEIYGAPPVGEGLKPWITSAPGFHLDRVQTPLRIEAIRAESVLGEWEIYSSLTMQRKPVEFIYFPKGQHILQKPLERLASQQGNVDWFRFWLKSEESVDPAKAQQNTRLHELSRLQEHNEKKSANAPSPNSH